MTRSELKYTADDYRTLPETGPRYELIDGELVLMSAPTTLHQRVLRRISTALDVHVERAGLGEMFFSPIDVYLGEHDVFQPDLIFVSTERRDRVRLEGIRGAPDLVGEVLSPSTSGRDLGVKRKTYAREGVREYWVVDADARTIEVHTLPGQAAAPVTHGPGSTLTSPLLPGFALSLEELFRE